MPGMKKCFGCGKMGDTNKMREFLGRPYHAWRQRGYSKSCLALAEDTMNGK